MRHCATPAAALTRKISESQFALLQQRNVQLRYFKQGVYNAFLFSAAVNAKVRCYGLVVR